MTKFSRLLAIGMMAAVIAELPVAGAQAASASPARASAHSITAKTATQVTPHGVGRYAGCTFRVDAVQGTNFNTGIANYVLLHNWEVYSDKDQDTDQNLWWVYSYSFGFFGWVDWHDLTLAFCNPQ